MKEYNVLAIDHPPILNERWIHDNRYNDKYNAIFYKITWENGIR